MTYPWKQCAEIKRTRDESLNYMYPMIEKYVKWVKLADLKKEKIVK